MSARAVGTERPRASIEAEHGPELLHILDVGGDALGDPEVAAEVDAVAVG
jgi:hypothetical protein